MAEMFDSDTATYPAGVQYIAAYVDGPRTGQNYSIAKRQNPNAKFLLVSAVGAANADVIDIEPGNVWPPANAVDWTIRQRSLGKNPGYYCNTSQRQQVLDAYAARGVNPGWWWRADYRDPSQRPASFALGELAHQYADPPMLAGHWDASVMAPALQAYLDGNASALTDSVTPIVVPETAVTTEEDDMANYLQPMIAGIHGAAAATAFDPNMADACFLINWNEGWYRWLNQTQLDIYKGIYGLEFKDNQGPDLVDGLKFVPPGQ